MGILPECFGGSNSRKQPSTRIEELCHRFSLAQLRKSTNNFDTSQIIGVGPYSDVYRGCISINGQAKDIAVKRVKAGRSTHGLSQFRNEIVLLCQLHHPNLVSLIGFCHDQNEMMVVYEYTPNGSLRDRLDRRFSNSPVLSWKKRLEISIGAARGLHYLHTGTKRTIFHRYVTPSNILLNENWVPKLTDFELSLKGPKFSSKAAKPIKVSGAAGTFGYIAPECYNHTITDKSDVYSFGGVLLALICGKTIVQILSVIWDKEAEDEDVNNGKYALSSFWNIAKEVRNIAEKGNAERIMDVSLVGEIAPECWKLYMDIAESCLNKDANERPTIGEVEVELEHALKLQEEADANHKLISPDAN